MAKSTRKARGEGMSADTHQTDERTKYASTLKKQVGD